MSNNIFFERGQMADKPNNYLWNGDCLELMKDIPDKSMDAIICDLPYGTTACKWDSVIPFEPLWEQYKRIIKENRPIILFGAEPFSSHLRMSNIKNYKYDWYWVKNKKTGFLNSRKMPMMQVETISVFFKKLGNTYNPIKEKRTTQKAGNKKYGNTKVYGKQDGEYKDNQSDYILPANVINKKVERGLHPTQKPLELLKYLVRTYTNENDWVLDNTCGSNTTGVACYDLHRNYIGIEKDKDIYEVAKKRMEKNILLRANKQETLFKNKP